MNLIGRIRDRMVWNLHVQRSDYPPDRSATNSQASRVYLMATASAADPQKGQ